MAANHQGIPIHYGMGCALRLQSEWCMYLSSSGVADPRIQLRARENNTPILRFDRCVFRFQPATASGPSGSSGTSSSKSSPLIYGRTVHLVHVHSGLYVTVVRKPSDANPAHFKVVLMSYEDAGGACRFRCMSRYKIRSEGDVVHNNDVMYLQQEGTQVSLHATVTRSATNPAEYDELNCEINAAESACAMEIVVYDENKEIDPRHPVLSAGLATMIFHREKDAILTVPSPLDNPTEATRGRQRRFTVTASQASLAGEQLKPPAPGHIVPFFRHTLNPVSTLTVESLPVTSNALWFFENIDPTIGGPLGVSAPCRLRHGVTGKYLVALPRVSYTSPPKAASNGTLVDSPSRHSYSQDYTVSLAHLDTQELLDASVLELELVASSVASMHILSTKSFVVAKHHASGMYLTTIRGTATSSFLTLSAHLNLEDTLALVVVPKSRAEELSFLIGNLEFLLKYIDTFYALQKPGCRYTLRDSYVTKIVNQAAQSLSALIRLCTESSNEDPLEREGLPVPMHQESMFQVALHKVAMEVLVCPFVAHNRQNKMELPLLGGALLMDDILAPENTAIHLVCRLCYRLLKQMSKSSPHAALLIEYVGFMQAQEGYKLHVADTLMEIFTDNPNLPPERCETDIRHFVHLLHTKGRSSGYLKFLSRLCVVGDMGVNANQQLVCRLILGEHRKEVLYPFHVEGGRLVVVLPKYTKKSEKSDKKDKKEKKPAAEEAAAAGSSPASATGSIEKPEKKEKKEKKEEEKTPPVTVPLDEFLIEGDSKMVKFFESSIELLGNLCIGGDDSSIQHVRQVVPVETLSRAIEATWAAPGPYLRASFFRIVQHAYLRQMLTNSAKQEHISNTTCGRLVMSANKLSPKERNIDPVEQAALLQEDRFLTHVKIEALRFLQAEGGMSEPGKAELVTMVTSIWHSFVSHGKHTRQELLAAVHAVITALDTRGDEGRYKRTEDTIASMTAKRGLIQFLNNVLNREVERIADAAILLLMDGKHEEAVQAVEANVKELSTSTFRSKEFFPVLMDLLMYDDKELVNVAIDVMVRICNAGPLVASKIAVAEPVKTPAAEQAFKIFSTANAALQQNTSISGNLVDEEAAIDVIQAMVSLDSRKMQLTTVAGGGGESSAALVTQTSFSSPSSGGSPSGGAKGRLYSKVSALMAITRVFGTVQDKRQRWRKDDAASVELARLMYMSQMHIVLLRALEHTSAGSNLQSALLEYFRVLSINKNAALELARSLPTFVSCVGDERGRPDAAQVIFNIIEHHRGFAADIDETTLNRFVTLLSATGDSSIAEGLEKVVLGEFPIERHQKVVLQLLHAHGLTKDLNKINRESTVSVLQKSAAIVSLMAACCVNSGTCRTLAATLLKPEDVVRILIADGLSPAHKTPFFKYFAAVAFGRDTDSTAQEQHLMRRQWTENSLWWTLMSASIMPNLIVPPPHEKERVEFVFSGLLPVVRLYYEHLFDAAVGAKAKHIVPTKDVATRLLLLSTETLGVQDTLPINCMMSLDQTIHAVATHCQEAVQNALKEAGHNLRKAILGKSAPASKATSGSGSDAAVKSALGVEVDFEEKWPLNNAESLKDAVALFLGTGGKMHEIPINNRPLHALHQKVINHIMFRDLSTFSQRGIMSIFRHCLGAVPPEHFEKGQLYLNDIGCLRMISELANNPEAEVVGDAMALAIAVLEGGNQAVQDSFLFHFMNTDERFFHDIGTIIKDALQQCRHERAREEYLAFYANCETERVDLSHVERIFRFLQLMCEGHHLGMQDYLREQRDNLRSVNVVKDVLSFGAELADNFEISHIDVLQQTLALLTEVCQGPCPGNQTLLVQCGVCTMVNKILTGSASALPDPFDVEAPHCEALLQLKLGSVTLLLALLEGVTTETIPLAMIAEVPIDGIEPLLIKLMETDEFKKELNEELCELVSSLVILLHTLVHGIQSEVHQGRIKANEVVTQVGSKVGSLGIIEIERNNLIEKVYFRVPQICSLLSEDSKQALLWGVDRSTQGSKLSDFLDKCDELIFDIEATHRVQERFKNNLFMNVLSKLSIDTWDNTSLAIAVIHNLLFLVVIEDAKGLLDKDVDWWGIEGVIRVLAYTQVIVCCVIALMFFVSNVPLWMYKLSKDVEKPSIFAKISCVVARPDALYRVATVLFAFLGLFVLDFFFAMHLLGLIGKSSVLKNVIVAVSTNGKSLLLTGMLGCIVVYMFSLVGFVMFQEHYEDACATLSRCVVHILSTGLRQGGGIGDAMSAVKYGDAYYYHRLIYDTLFWALMIVIFLNILFGIIIDTFAELRDEKSKKEEDMNTKCFICGLDSYTFDRYGEGFEKHSAEEHNLWNYLYFFHHLRRKDKNDYTGQESYVSDMLEKSDIGFFPAGKCLSLKGVVDRPADDEDSKTDDEAPSTSSVASAASQGAKAKGEAGDASPTADDSSTQGQQAVDPALLQRIMQRLDQLPAVLAQSAQPSSSAPNPWLSRLGGGSAGERRNTMGRSTTAPPNSSRPEGLSPVPASGLDSFSSSKEREAMQGLIDRLNRERDEVIAAHAQDIATVTRYSLNFARWQNTVTSLSDETLTSMSGVFSDAVIGLGRAYAEQLAAALREASLATIELDGLKAQRAAAKEKFVVTGPAASGAYVGSLQDLMQEGDRYMQLLRSAVRESRAARPASSPEKSS